MNGSCLCGAVRYAIEPPLPMFQYCHCSRCRKVSGSAHGANLFVPVAQFRWLAGESLAARFELPEARYFGSGFCRQCGSSLPWLARNGKNMVVPAGGLDDDPGIRPQQVIYWGSRAPWYVASTALCLHDELPPKN